MPRSNAQTMARLRFQRRHYQFMAEVIKAYVESNSVTLAEDFAGALQGTNANFDRERFLAACGERPAPKPKCLLCQSE